MTIEEQLKQFILSKYGTLTKFGEKVGLSQSTLSTIFKRGIQRTSITRIFKICDELGISADALAEGQIIPKNEFRKEVLDLNNALALMSNQYILAIDNVPLSRKEILLMEGYINLTIELLRKNRLGDKNYLYMTNYPELNEHEREREF